MFTEFIAPILAFLGIELIPLLLIILIIIMFIKD